MLRTDVAGDLRREFEEDGYLFPDYEEYCFANVAHSVASALGVETGRTLPEDVFDGVSTDDYDTVLVVLVDGFGFRQWRHERDHHEFLDRLSSAARVTPLTSIYPSETAAAMTTLHTGTLPAEHGVVGWNVYEPAADAAFEALPFLTKDGEEPPIPRSDVADADSLYTELADAGVSAHHVVPYPETPEGATRRGYETLAEFAERVPEAVRAADPPSYCFGYLGHVDAAAHESGTESPTYRETVGEVFDALESILWDIAADGTAENTLLVVAADHGHVNTDPERNVNLDRREELVAALRRHADGTPVKFSGSMHNVHLQLRDDLTREATADVTADLRAELDALVFERENLLDGDLFGDAPPSETFRRRVGDVVVSHRNLGCGGETRNRANWPTSACTAVCTPTRCWYRSPRPAPTNWSSEARHSLRGVRELWPLARLELPGNSGESQRSPNHLGQREQTALRTREFASGPQRRDHHDDEDRQPRHALQRRPGDRQRPDEGADAEDAEQVATDDVPDRDVARAGERRAGRHDRFRRRGADSDDGEPDGEFRESRPASQCHRGIDQQASQRPRTVTTMTPT
jgi:hypothetical protein